MKDDWARLQKWGAIFKNKSQLVNVVFSNFIANRSGIFADVAELKADEKDANAKDLGLTVADLIVKLIGEVPASSRLVTMLGSLTPEDVNLFLNGLLTTLVNDDNLSNVENCTKDVEGIDTVVETAIADFKRKTISGYIAGGKQIASIIQMVPKDEPQCAAVAADLKRVETWAKLFEHPSELIKIVIGNVARHADKIVTDVESIRANEGKDYEVTGQSVGDLIIEVFGEVPAASSDFVLY